MTTDVDPFIVEQIAKLVDGEAWALADFLVEQFPTDAYGAADRGTHTGLYAKLEKATDALRREHGIDLKPSYLRQVRATAVKWPDAERSASAPFAVHQMMLGDDRQTVMARYLKRNRGKPLTARKVRSFKAEDNPKPMVPWDEQARRRVESTVRSLLLGGVIPADSARWWDAAGQEARAVMAGILHDLGDRLA